MHSSMPILAESGDRPGCLPGSKDEPFLPSINNAVSPASIPKNKDGVRYFSPTNNNNNNNSSTFNNKNNKNNDASLAPSESFNGGKKMYSSAPASESSTPFKLPSIDRSISSSVSSLASERYGHKLSRGRSRDRRSKLNRSPSCPSNLGYWHDHDEREPEGPMTPETVRVGADITSGSTFVRPYFTHREDSSGVKLPSIFQHRNSINSSFTLTSSTANSSAQTSRDTSPFSFKREPTFLNLAHRDLSPDGSKPKLSPRSEFDEPHRSGTQTSALLLPISTTADSKHGSKGKRKRKKMNSLIASDGQSDAERLLREKLGAIERRDSNGVSPVREIEKTDLSDTNFIDRVKDETTKAIGEKNMTNNGARDTKLGDNLATKPPIYQNTPTRIKTEKKVASVKA